MTDYVLQLLARASRQRLSTRPWRDPAAMREALSQTPALRHIVEVRAKGNIKHHPDREKLGVEKNRIRLVFNKVDADEAVEEEFTALFGLAEAEKFFVVRPDAVICMKRCSSA